MLTRENSEYQTPFVLGTSCDIKNRLNFNQLIRSLDLNQNGWLGISNICRRNKEVGKLPVITLKDRLDKNWLQKLRLNAKAEKYQVRKLKYVIRRNKIEL